MRITDPANAKALELLKKYEQQGINGSLELQSSQYIQSIQTLDFFQVEKKYCSKIFSKSFLFRPN
jgi:hypothetical protein